MTHPNDEKDPESRLASLFDRTAKTPVDEVRAKLAGHARDVGGAKPRSGLRGFGVWVPAFAAAAAVAYFAVPARHPALHDGAASASAAVVGATSGTTSGAASVPAPAAPAADETEADDPAFAVLVGEPDDVEPFDLGPLMGPELHRRGSGRSGREIGERQVQRSAP
jgi:hypothetical protein